MPATTIMSLRSRIQAFEALSSSPSTTMPDTSPTSDIPTPSHLLESPISPTASSFHPITPFLALNRSRSASPSTPSLAGQASLIDLKDWIVEDGPVDPPSPSRHTLIAGVRKLNGIRESSRTPSPSGRPTPNRVPSNSSTPLINFEPPSKPRPPLPPRKPSFNVNVPADRVSTQHSVSAATETVTTLHPPGRPDSLTIEHTYPPGPHKFGAGRVGHAPASSISSFHSVSLSSDGGNIEIHTGSTAISSGPPSFTFDADSSIVDFDTASIAESFENVSAPSVHSPFDWEQPTTKPKSFPRLVPPSRPNRASSKIIVPVVPPKPLARSISASSTSTATSTRTRRPPPPPPPYQPRSRPSSSRASVVSTSASTSDRSSILSNATTTSRTSTSTQSSAQPGTSVKPSPLLRPTPVPSAARSRYESLFDSAVKGRRKAAQKTQKSKLLAPPPLPAQKGRQAGWRDLSVECLTDLENHPDPYVEKRADESDNEEEEEPVGPEERLNGRIVKYIWSASRLDRKKLGSIWNDCESQGAGSIDRDTFVRAMWRIDEELRRTQLAQRTSALSAASSQRIPHRPCLPPRSQSAARLLI